MITTEFPMPVERIVCFFCNRPLLKDGKWDGLTLCTSSGVAVLTCEAHAEWGDEIIYVINLWRQKQSENLRQVS